MDTNIRSDILADPACTQAFSERKKKKKKAVIKIHVKHNNIPSQQIISLKAFLPKNCSHSCAKQDIIKF